LTQAEPFDEQLKIRGQFKKFNLGENDLDLEIPCFAIQDQVINFTFVPVIQSENGINHPDPDTHFIRLPNQGISMILRSLEKVPRSIHPRNCVCSLLSSSSLLILQI